MGDPPVDLAALIDRAMERHQVTSTNALSKLAQRNGHRVVNTTLSQIRNGSYPYRPKRVTIEALAWLAGVSYRTAHEAAGLGTPAEVPFADELPEDVDLLTPKQRHAARAVLRALVDAQKAILSAERRTEDERWMDPDTLDELDDDEDFTLPLEDQENTT